MLNTNLYRILITLDKYEVNRLKKYILSPYFNSDVNILKLYDFITQEITKNRTKNLTKEIIWKKVIPAKSFDDTRFRKYCSDLLKLIEGYFAQEGFESDPNLKYSKLLNHIRLKKLDFFFSKSVKKAKKYLENEPLEDGNTFFSKYRFEKDYYNLYQDQLRSSFLKNMELIGKNLDCFFIAEKLRLYCLIHAQSGVYSGGQYDIKMMEEIFDFIKDSEYLEIPVVGIYFVIAQTFNEPDNLNHYYELKQLLKNHSHILTKEEARYVYTFARNYCVRQLNKGNGTFLKELFDLFLELLDKKIILDENNILSPWDFKNINLVSLRLGKYDWTEQFINDYSKYLPEKSRKNAVTYNLAQLYYYQKKNEKVIEQLRDVEYEDLSYNLNSKTMLIATYYELEDLDPLYSMFESFRTYLNRHKEIPEAKRNSYIKYIKYTKKLTNLPYGNKDAIKKFKEEEIKET